MSKEIVEVGAVVLPQFKRLPPRVEHASPGIEPIMTTPEIGSARAAQTTRTFQHH